MTEKTEGFTGAVVEGFGGPSLVVDGYRSMGLHHITGKADNIMPDTNYYPLTGAQVDAVREEGVDTLPERIRGNGDERHLLVGVEAVYAMRREM